MSKKNPAPQADQQASLVDASQGSGAEAERLAAEQAEAERLAAEQAEAERLAAEQAEAERLAAEQAEAERLAAEQAAEYRARTAAARLQRVPAVLLRREPIEGVWYPAGIVLELPAELAEQCHGDGALDTNTSAVQHALANGAQRVNHVPPPADDQA